MKTNRSVRLPQAEKTAFSKRLLDVEETAKFLGLKPRTIYNRVAPKAKDPFPVKPRRIGRKVLFDIRDLEAFVSSI